MRGIHMYLPLLVESTGVEPVCQALQRPALSRQTPHRLLQMALLEHQALRALATRAGMGWYQKGMSSSSAGPAEASKSASLCTGVV